MKLIIDIPEEIYKDIKEENGIYGINNGLNVRITGKVVGAIQNGTPLEQESILDKIRAEIIDMRSKQNCSCSDCLDIIDKYKVESEVSE